MTAAAECVVGPLDFGPGFDPYLPEKYVPPAKQMRMDLEALQQAKKRRESQAKRLRKSADLLTTKIEDEEKKVRAATQDYTVLAAIVAEDNLRKLQSALLVIADGAEKDTLPAYLQALSSKNVIECVVNNSYPLTNKTKEIKALTECGIADAQELLNTHEALAPYLWKRTEKEQYQRDVQISTLKCRQKMQYQEYETPAPLGARMVFAAEIERGQSVLEPSAGLGALADLILDWETTSRFMSLRK